MIDWIKKNSILRWVLLLPTAIVGGLLVALIWVGFVHVVLHSCLLREILVKVIPWVLFSSLFIWIGFFVAPNKKKKVANFLFVLIECFLALCFLVALGAVYNNYYYNLKLEYNSLFGFWDLLGMVLGIVSAISAYNFVKK